MKKTQVEGAKPEVVDAQVVEQAVTAVAVAEPTNGALVSVAADAAALAAMMAEDEGDGLENVTAADVAIPYLKLLQKGSPECEDGNQAFMEAALPGMLLDSVTRALVDIRSAKGNYAVVVPVSYVKVISVWRPNQGGKVADLPMNQATLDAAIRTETPDGGVKLLDEDGNILEETAKFHVLLAGAGGVHWGIMALSGSKLGASKKWMALITEKKIPGTIKAYPMYGFTYRVSSFLDTSKRTGKTYQNLRFEDGGRITDVNLYAAAKEYRQAVKAGTVKEADPDVVGEPLPTDEPAF